MLGNTRALKNEIFTFSVADTLASEVWMEKNPHHSHQVALICVDAHVLYLHLFGGENWQQKLPCLLHKVDIGQFSHHHGWIDFWSSISILLWLF